MPEKKVKVIYFAKLREERGCSNETIVTTAQNTGELYDELRQRHQFSWDKNLFKVAVNEEIQSWDFPLKDNDTVVFIQPVAGG